MLKIKIENEKRTNSQWHDLMEQTGIKVAYDHLDTIFLKNEDYIITDIESDWAQFDKNTALDDMVDTANVIDNMLEDEVELYKLIYSAGIQEPLDIAYKVRYHEMKYIEDVCEDDEIWETVFFEKEEREIAITYHLTRN